MFDWIVELVERTGYWGIAFLMFAENVFPPVPSELIMPLAGYSAATGELNIALVILSGTLGSLAGALFWYYIGRTVGAERLKRWADKHGRWATISADDVDTVSLWFRERGGKAILIGRMVPAIRTLISVPAGIARMPLAPFLVYTTIGTALWTSLLAAAGFILEAQFQLVEDWVNPVSTVIVVGLVAWYVWRVATFRSREAK